MNDPFPNEDWLTGTPCCEPRQVHLILKPSTCAVRRGVPAVRLKRDGRSAPRGGGR